MFSTKKILDSLPGFTVNNATGGFLLGTKGKEVRRGELYLGILDLTFRWARYPLGGPKRSLCCGMCESECVLLCIHEMSMWMKQTNSETNCCGCQQLALPNTNKIETQVTRIGVFLYLDTNNGLTLLLMKSTLLLILFIDGQHLLSICYVPDTH